MRLLDQIVEDCISEHVPLQVVLRKCLVLASDLKNERLKAWVSGELNGYGDGGELPPYREIGAPAVGMLIGIANAVHDNPIPAYILDEKHRHFALTVKIKQGVAALQSLIAADTNGFMTLDWPADLVAQYQDKVARGYNLNRAYQKIPKSAIVGICDGVRNRLLELAIDVRSELGAGPWPPNAEVKAHAEQSVTTIIYGGQNVVGSNVSGSIIQAEGHAVVKGDFASLAKALTEASATLDEIADLKLSIEMDRSPESGFGPAVKEWIGKIGRRVSGAAGAIASNSVTASVTSMIKAYLGIP